MYFARYKNLFDLLLPHYGDDALHQVQDAFTMMGLPMPEQMEYRDTTDVGAMAFLNPYGCTVRVTNRKRLLCETALRHPRLLQPLGTFPDTILRIDVFPGIRPLLNSRLLPALQSDFLDSGLFLSDGKIANCGSIPCKATHTGEYAVVYDTPSVTPLNGIYPDDEPFVIAEDKLQERLFGHLHKAFVKALANKNFAPFWDLCAEERSRGLLKASWMETTLSPVYQPAAAYERRLAQHQGINRSVIATHYSGYNLGALL